MTDVKNTIDEHDEWVQSTSVDQVTEDKKADLHENLDAANVVDTMEFFMMSNEVTEKFREEIKKANIQSLKDVSMIDFSYRTNDREHFSDFLGLNVALEKILANPEKKILLTSLIDVDRFLNTEKIGDDQKNKLKLLLSKPNVKFLQVPYTLDELGAVFHENEMLNNNEVIESMQFTFDNWTETFISKLKKEISEVEHSKLKNSRIILCEIKPTLHDQRSDFKGIALAYEEYLKNSHDPIILTSFCSIEQLTKHASEEAKLTFLLSKPNVRFIRLPFYGYDLPKLFTDIDNENEISTETAFQKILENEINHFLHDAKYRVETDGSKSIEYDDRLAYFFNQPEDIKSEKRIAFENKLIWLLQLQHPSFKTFPRKNNLQWIVDTYKYARMQMLPEWTKFEGVFVDRDGCIYSNTNKAFNQDVIDLVKKYEQEGKQIRLWTQGNIELKQKLLDEAGLPYIVESKTDYKGWTVEISIDNDSQETLYGKAKIKSNHHIQVKTAK